MDKAVSQDHFCQNIWQKQH